MGTPSNKPRISTVILFIWLMLIVVSPASVSPPISAATRPTTMNVGDAWGPEKLQNEFPNLTSPGIVYLKISGANTSSEETYAAYLRAKKRMESMGLTVFSYYEFQRAISNQSLNVALTSLRNATNLVTEVYSTLSHANRSFGTILNESFEIYPLFKLLNSTLPELEEAYREGYSNASRTQLQFLELQEVLNESSKDYLSIHRNLSVAQEVVNNLTVGVTDFNDHLETLKKNYTITYLRVIWTYKGLRDLIKSYEVGSAYPCKVASLSLYLHLPEDFIYNVFYATYPAYEKGGYAGITDELLANVTVNFVLEGMNSSPYKAFDREFGGTFVSKVRAYDARQGNERAIIENTHDQFGVLTQLINGTLTELPSRLASSSSTYYFPPLGNVSGHEISFILREVNSQKNAEKAAVDIALALNAGGIPREYYSVLSSNDSLDSIELSLLNESLSRRLPEDLKRFSYNISLVIVNYERADGYGGVLSSDPEILRSATLDVIEIVSPGFEPTELEEGEGLPPAEMAEKALTDILEERLSNSALNVPPAFPSIVAEIVAQHSLGRGEDVQEETLSEIFRRAFGQYAGILVTKFYSGSSPGEAAVQVFKERVVPEILSNASPENYQLIEGLLEEIPPKHPLTQGYIKEVSLNVTLQRVESWKPKIHGRSVELPAPLIAEMAWEFKGNSNLITESDVSELSNKIYESALEAHRDSVLTLKGPENDSLVVIIRDTNETSNTTPGRVREVFSTSFKSVGPLTSVVLIAPINFTASTPQESSDSDGDFNTLLLIITLIGWATLFMALRGPLLATILPSLTALAILKLLSETVHRTTAPNQTLLIMGSLLASSSAFSIAYRITESFRRSLSSLTSEGISSGDMLKEITYGALAVTLLSGTGAVVLNLPVAESLVTTLMTTIPLLLALGVLLIVSTRILGDKLIFWWPMSAEKVLRNENNGRGKLLKAGIGVFVGSLLVTGGVAHFLIPPEDHGIRTYGGDVYLILEGSGIKGPSFQIAEKVAESIAGRGGVEAVYTVTMPYGVPLNLSAGQLMETWASSYVSRDGRAILLVVKINPSHPFSAEKLIQDTLNKLIRSNPEITDASYENGIIVLKTR